MRAHGAWIYLFLSIGAGALVGTFRAVEPALLAGTGFAGAFLVLAAVHVGPRKKLRQLLLGTALTVFAPVLAVWLGAKPVFLFPAALTLLPACTAIVLAKNSGALSPATLVSGIAALTMSAPVTAFAGGSSPLPSAILYIFLWSFFSWRALRIANSLVPGVGWNRELLRIQGLREAALSAIWTLAVALGLRLA